MRRWIAGLHAVRFSQRERTRLGDISRCGLFEQRRADLRAENQWQADALRAVIAIIV